MFVLESEGVVVQHADFPCFTVEEFNAYFWRLEGFLRAYPCIDCDAVYRDKMVACGRCRHPETCFDDEEGTILDKSHMNQFYLRHIFSDHRKGARHA